MKQKFLDLKERILASAKSAQACRDQYRERFAGYSIHCNESVDSGYILVDNATTVEALDNATVRAWDNATTVEALDNAYFIQHY